MASTRLALLGSGGSGGGGGTPVPLMVLVVVLQFPKYRNLRVLEKANECLDFGAWAYGLSKTNWRGGHYKRFIFINSSVRGPFVPQYVPKSIHWTQFFTNLLREDGDGYADNGPIKLVGLTINCQFSPHVQSMLWATDLAFSPTLLMECINQ